MGVALAAEAAALGADVTLLGANLAVPAPAGVDTIAVETAEQLRQACLEHFPVCDVLLMSAAVADFRPVDPAGEKLKKTERDDLVVTMEPTTDILSELSSGRGAGQLVVGFAAETGEKGLEYARGKLSRKGLDAVILNDVAQAGIGFDSPENEVTIITADGERQFTRAGKPEIARAIMETVSELRANRARAAR
jgi:phosphopantothenoylcysteine decarboxylase/phosphopantothenate--cysteine ligase